MSIQPKRKRRRSPGLEVKERDGYWHVEGTVRAGGRSCRVRKSTGHPADDAHYDDAVAERNRVEREIIDAAVHGVKPSRSFAQASLDYLERARKRPLGATHIRTVKHLAKHFGLKLLRDIDASEIAKYFSKYHAGKKAETHERYKNTLCAILVHSRNMGHIDQVPYIDRDDDARFPLRHKRITNRWLPLEDCFLLIDHAASHLRPQLAVKFATGARDPQLIGARIGDFTLAPGHGKVIFHGTKNDDDVVASLQDWAVSCVQEYFQTARRNARRNDPAFLTNKGKPYVDFGGRWGGRIKKGFNAARRRAADYLIEEAKRKVATGLAETIEETEEFGRAASLRKATPHWLRHSMATHMLKGGADLGTTMAQGGWRDARSLSIYDHDIPDHRRAAVNRIQRVGGNAPAATSIKQRKKIHK